VIPGGAASVLRWVRALDPANSSMDVWALLDDTRLGNLGLLAVNPGCASTRRDHGEYRTRRLVLDAYNRMATATARGGSEWTRLAGQPAGHGPRHPAGHT
jgi:hypothetical protein